MGACCATRGSAITISSKQELSVNGQECQQDIKSISMNNKPSEKNLVQKSILSSPNKLKIENTNKSYELDNKKEQNPENFKLTQELLDKIKESSVKQECVDSIIVKANNNIFEDFGLIEESLNSYFFIKKLERDVKELIIKTMSLVSFLANQVIYTQGSLGDYFYIVREGTLRSYENLEYKSVFKPGSSFGEVALMYVCSRTSTVIAATPTKLWILNRTKYREVLDLNAQLKFDENKTFIESIKILKNLDEDQKIMLSTNLIKAKFNKGNFIVKEGDIGNCLYIVKSGKVICSKSGNVIRTLEKGECFGELSILLKSKRTLDVVAKTNCECFTISVDMLIQMMGEKYVDVLYLNFIKMSFANSKYFSPISLNILESIFSLFEVKNYVNDQIIFESNEKITNRLIVVITGSIVGSNSGVLVGDTGNILGQKEIIEGKTIAYTEELIARPDCLLLSVSLEAIESKMKWSLKKIIELSSIVNCLTKVNVFKNFTNEKLKKLAEKTNPLKYKKSSIVIKEGDIGDRFFFIKKGKVNVSSKGKYLRTLNENEYFGERALFFNEPRSATVSACEDSDIYYIEAEAFKKIVDSKVKEYITQILHLQDNTIELKDLMYLSILGNGSYGNVYLVSCIKNNSCYALKRISKSKIDFKQIHESVELEKKVLLKIDHPFIVKLVKTLKDESSIFFLMEHINGKDLFEVLRDIGLLNDSDAQFYGASLILACNYLHHKKIIYRDIKPENVIVTLNVRSLI